MSPHFFLQIQETEREKVQLRAMSYAWGGGSWGSCVISGRFRQQWRGLNRTSSSFSVRFSLRWLGTVTAAGQTLTLLFFSPTRRWHPSVRRNRVHLTTDDVERWSVSLETSFVSTYYYLHIITCFPRWQSTVPSLHRSSRPSHTIFRSRSAFLSLPPYLVW